MRTEQGAVASCHSSLFCEIISENKFIETERRDALAQMVVDLELASR